MEWSKNLLEKHPKTRKALEQWVHGKLEKVQQELALDAGVTEFPKLDEEKSKQYVPYSLAGSPDYFLQFFDKQDMYVSIVWEINAKHFYLVLKNNENIKCSTERSETVIKAIEILFEQYEGTKVS